MNTGLIHLYIGEGKGKTTAAVGLAARAAGSGKKVVFGQLLKGQLTGEVASLEALGVKVIRTDKDQGFVWQMNEEQLEECRKEQVRLFKEIWDNTIFSEPGIDLLVADESLDVLFLGLLEEQMIRDVLEKKPEGLEIVCTGRQAPEWMFELADYVTEMKKIKHPYDRGVGAREAIEY